MIVQACLNGIRCESFHPRLPLTVKAILDDAEACIRAGAAELHIHPRGSDGRESLEAVDDTVQAIRKACPGTLVGVSTGAWIESDEDRTRKLIEDWSEPPDYASVNLSEPDAPAVMETLRQHGVGIEAGLASVADAERFLTLPHHHRVFRILIEINEQNLDQAIDIAEGIDALLNRKNLHRPMLLHGLDATVWPLLERARKKRWSTRIGLEDGKTMPDGSIATDNAALIRAAVAIYRDEP